MKKIFVLTGEPSGDKLASKVISKLKNSNPDIEYLSVGGENLKALGIESLYDLNEVTYLGFTKVLLNVFKIKKKIKETVDKRWGLSPRQIFQTFGTDLIRNEYPKLVPGSKVEKIGSSFWVYRFQIWYENWIKENPKKVLIITDIRFPDEFEVLKNMGGTIIKITRPSYSINDNHISEKNISKIDGDHHLINEGTLEEYQNKIEQLYLKIIK